MKQIMHFAVLLIGAFTVLTGTTACTDKDECCEYTDSFGDFYRYCEDNIPAGYTWDYIRAATFYYGGECD